MIAGRGSNWVHGQPRHQLRTGWPRVAPPQNLQRPPRLEISGRVSGERSERSSRVGGRVRARGHGAGPLRPAPAHVTVRRALLRPDHRAHQAAEPSSARCRLLGGRGRTRSGGLGGDLARGALGFAELSGQFPMPMSLLPLSPSFHPRKKEVLNIGGGLAHSFFFYTGLC